jgi:2-isopropylmalate synthase
MKSDVLVYDTTLRDGTQGENITFSAEDKIRIAQKLDSTGFHYIEGGWPGSNPKDARFFALVRKIAFKESRLAAFGSTRGPDSRAESNANVRALLKAETETVTIFGKSWDLHVVDVMNITLDENLSMIADTVSYLKRHGREVIYDAEHFFDGYKHNSEYALKTLQAAINEGSDIVVLCDTNGGTLPTDISKIMNQVALQLSVPMGIHAHNDCALAVANSLSAVAAGATLIQGTVNGYGERCGNADLISVIANLQVKMGKTCIPEPRLKQLVELSRYVSEVANIPPFDQRAFVGNSAFAHKAGVHVSAIMKVPSAYEHMDPELVGNRRRVIISDLAGKSNVAYKAQELNIPDANNGEIQIIVQEVKRLEDLGYQYDAAEGSFELLMKKLTGRFVDPFSLKTLRVVIEKNEDGHPACQATVKISVGGVEEITAAEGDGPVNAMDNALRKALYKFYPQLEEMRLVDFKVRVIEGGRGTAAKVRVLIESRDQKSIWNTVGVSENIIEASWQALVESLQYKLSLEQNGK